MDQQYELLGPFGPETLNPKGPNPRNHAQARGGGVSKMQHTKSKSKMIESTQNQQGGGVKWENRQKDSRKHTKTPGRAVKKSRRQGRSHMLESTQSERNRWQRFLEGNDSQEHKAKKGDREQDAHNDKKGTASQDARRCGFGDRGPGAT